MTALQDSIKLLTKNYEGLLERIKGLGQTIGHMEQERTELLAQMDALLITMQFLKKQNPSLKLPEMEIPPEIKFNTRGIVTLGNAIESILRERGELSRLEILEELRKQNFEIKSKNARIVLANAIKRDSRKRFIETENGKIALRKENEKADAKG